MAKLSIENPTFTEARELLGQRETVKIGHNTWAERVGQPGSYSIGIRLHGTYVVTLHADDTVTLNSGGYRSVTTKQRMNAILPRWIGVVQSDFEWFVWDRRTDTRVPFEDGMTLDI